MYKQTKRFFSKQQALKPLRHILKISDLNKNEILNIISNAKEIKKNPTKYNTTLKDKTLLMLFEKPSLRTRVSFEVGMTQLGGHAIFYSIADSPLGVKETFGDTGACLSRYSDVIMARVKSKHDVSELANNSSIPVINGLDDWAHPCQMLADFMTIDEYKNLSNASKLKMCYIGDCHNNVTYDLMRCASILGIHINVCGPVNKSGYHVDNDVIDECNQLNGSFTITDNVNDAVSDVDIIYTDSWMSYGISESDKQARINTFMPYQVNDEIMNLTKSDSIFMNCLPAMRGMEQTSSVIDGNKSIVFDQAENRLHAQKSLLLYLVNGNILPNSS